MSKEHDWIVGALKISSDTLPMAAMEAAHECYPEIVPYLIRCFESTLNAYRNGQPPQDAGHQFAAYLLADFRETEFLPLFCQLFEMSSDELSGFITNEMRRDLGTLVYYLAEEDPLPLIQSIFLNEGIDPAVRFEVVEAYFLLHFHEKVSIQEHLPDLERAMEICIEKRLKIAKRFARLFAVMGIRQAIPLVTRAADAGLLVDTEYGLKNFHDDLESTEEETNEWFFEGVFYPSCYFRDSIDYLLDTQELLVEDGDDEVYDDEYDDPDYDQFEGEQWLGAVDYEDDDDPSMDPATNPTNDRKRRVEVGRNDPCPCLSGKKYKKCCGQAGSGKMPFE